MSGRIAFARAFALLMQRHGETPAALARALALEGLEIDRGTLRLWVQGLKAPAHARSLAVLSGLERRWRLPAGYFRDLLPARGHALRAAPAAILSGGERRRLAWHLPEDFDGRPRDDQQTILDWVRRTFVSGATSYRRYHKSKVRDPYAFRFPGLPGPQTHRLGALIAPDILQREVADLLAFKTPTLTPPPYRRRSAWNLATAAQKVEHLGLVFGALSADPAAPAAGLGVPADQLRLALLTFPRVWDAYLAWRIERRGFFTQWEEDLMKLAASLAHRHTGWFTQRPDLLDGLQPLPGLVDAADLAAARRNWRVHCHRLRRFARDRAKELRGHVQVHNDPFEAIRPVLEADRPVAVYRRIAEEVLRRRPSPRDAPKAAAEATRAFLMLRLGLHLGFRQRNLRELLIAPRGHPPRSEAELAMLRRGELRFDAGRRAWVVFAPAAAFKNAHSRFFSGGPFVLQLPDLGGLYAELERYLDIHRVLLLGCAPDPGTLFVKTTTPRTTDASYSQAGFYDAWRAIIARYGIYNPWTGRGAVRGLLPHGPHSVRDVLATHVLKETGSFEQASYAIQDTPETLQQHYARFLPQEKAAIAARILNRSWVDP